MSVSRDYGWHAIAPYFLLFYIVPIGLMLFFGSHVNFNNEGNVFLVTIVFIFVAFLTYLFSKTKISLPIRFFSRLPNFFEKKIITFCLAIIFLPIAVNFNLEYGSGFRYSNAQISESGLIPLFVDVSLPTNSSRYACARFNSEKPWLRP